MENQPKVSIITVCFNAKEMLITTLEDIRKQKYDNLEYIVVDGKSSDGTLDLLNNYQDIISKIVSEPDKGIYDAMNKGINIATGEWAIFMNAGDTFADENVLTHVFKEGDDADVIYGDVIKYSSDGKRTIKKAEKPHNAHRMFFCHQSALTRISCLREFPYDIKYRLSADFHLYKRLYLSGKRFKQVDFPISVFDTTGASNTHRSKGLIENIQIIRSLDNVKTQLCLLPKMYFVLAMCKIRNK